MDAKAVAILKNYISNLQTPTKKLRKQNFYQDTYSKWAAEEILRAILLNMSTSPVMVVEEFRERMNDYSLKNSKTSFIFSVAYDTATDILDLFLTMDNSYLKLLKSKKLKT